MYSALQFQRRVLPGQTHHETVPVLVKRLMLRTGFMRHLCEAQEKKGADMKRLTKHALVAIIAVAFVVGLCPGLASAQVGNVVVSDGAQAAATNVTVGNADLATGSDSLGTAEARSGTYGTCNWTFDNGLLTISAGEFPYSGWQDYVSPAWPWKDFSAEITSVVIEPGAKANKSIANMFYGCNNLKTADLSGLDVSATEYITSFSSLNKLTTLNLSGWDTTNAVNNSLSLPNMLSEVTLGSKTVFHEGTYLPEPSTAFPYTGKWVRDGSDDAVTSREFMKLASKENAAQGTWRWQIADVEKHIAKAEITIGSTDVPWASGGSWTFMDKDGAFELNEKVVLNGKALKRDQDYTVSYYPYKNGDPFTPTTPGTYWVCIAGAGEFVGMQYISTHFYGPNDLIRATVAYEKEVAKGSGASPITSVQMDGKTLVEGKDYDLQYCGKDMYGDLNKKLPAAPTEPGKYRVRVMGKGDYTGSTSVDYNVVDKGSGEGGGSGSLDPIDEGADIASGTWGTCPWTISGKGVLTVGAGTGADMQNSSPWEAYGNKVTQVLFAPEGGKVVLPARCYNLFGGLTRATAMDLKNADTSGVTSMHNMFQNCSSLVALNISGWDISGVTLMGYMFDGCSKLASLDVSDWDISNVTGMPYMFYGCSSLATLDVSGWDTSKARTMGGMFIGCSKLSSLDVSKWDTSSVTNISGMFRDCSSLATLDVSGWKTSSATRMASVFDGCSSLASLDLSGWSTAAARDVKGIFSGCSKLASLNFGPAFKIEGVDVGLPDIVETDAFTGKWERASDKAVATSAELVKREDLEGAWSWQKKAQDGPTPTPGPDPTPTPTPSPDPAPEKPDLKQYEGTAAKSGMADLRAGEWFMDPATGAFPGTSTLYIDYTIARGLMGGYKDDSGRVTAFGPHDPLSRAQTATILYRLAKPDSKATTEPAAYEDNESGLADVASRQYYTAAVNWCVKEGIITGYKNAQGKYTTFGPDDSVSREQLATMIFRYCTKYAKRDADTADITSFSDYGKINDWARDGVAYCVANKIVGGYTDGSGRFGPQDSAERCQMSKIIAVTAYMLE